MVADLVEPGAAALVLRVLPHGPDAALEEHDVAALLLVSARRIERIHHRPEVLHIGHVGHRRQLVLPRLMMAGARR